MSAVTPRPALPADRWTRAAYLYGVLLLAGVGYFLLDLPVQLTDSYGNIVGASEGTLGNVVYRQFFQRGCLRPFLFAHIRVLLDLAGDQYFWVFRGWHVVQVALLIALFMVIVRAAPGVARRTGVLVGVVFIAAWMVGARGVSRRGIAAQFVLLAGYFYLRFVALDVGAPGLQERSSGFGFSSRDPSDLVASFSGNPLPFYAYNVVSSVLTVFIGEPREAIRLHPMRPPLQGDWIEWMLGD
jgi:hypothetical protein